LIQDRQVLSVSKTICHRDLHLPGPLANEAIIFAYGDFPAYTLINSWINEYHPRFKAEKHTLELCLVEVKKDGQT
jgi:hypothetical protein